MANEGLHESESSLDSAVVDRHRALTSIGEELEAIDWYDQRVVATSNRELAEILAHNRDEEKEHAAMTLEWLRRNDPVLDRHLRTYLFSSGSVLEEEEEAEHGSGEPEAAAPDHAQGDGARVDGSLGIGSLK